MVKKGFLFYLLVMALLSLSSVKVYADSPDGIALEAEYVDPSLGGDDNQRSPILIPQVGIDGHTLYFGSCLDGYAIQLVYYLNGQEVIAYSDVISGNATSWQLPISLSGEFEIRFIIGNLRFWGYIELP